jgi:dipeptidyl aminopeptidase/acylaminoacyl peptidase
MSQIDQLSSRDGNLMRRSLLPGHRGAMSVSVAAILLLTALSLGGCQSSSTEAAKAEAPPVASGDHPAAHIFSVPSAKTSFVFIQTGSTGPHRLTTRTTGWETDGVISPKGDAVAYAVADGPEDKSEVWVSRIDGTHAHRVSEADDDASNPAFGPDGKWLLYAKSNFYGHYSPIARSRKHKYDVVKVAVDPEDRVAGAVPVQLTQQEFFDLRSLAVSADGERFLVSTTGYPIGSLFLEFEIAKPLAIKRIFQPHVPSEPRMGPAFGPALYTNDGAGIVFSAASEGKDGKYNYNVYQMSAVTAADLNQLTQRSGMIDEISVGADGTVYFSEGIQRYALDPKTRQLKQE